MNLIIPIGPEDHIQGSHDAPVTLVEYGDFECPHCGRAYPIVKEIQHALGDDVRFVFRHFPLTQLHPRAQAAAQAAKAASRQEKFWEMYDLLFENQEALEPEDLLGHAEDLELDRGKFSEDFQDSAVIQHVHQDFIGGVRSGVSGTPTFFINGVRYDDDLDFETLLASLVAAQESLQSVRDAPRR